jgi:hypothetical protein
VNILNTKIFPPSTAFKLVCQISRNSVYSCDFLRFIISVKGGHCGYLPCVPKKLASPLHVMILCMASEHRLLFMTISRHSDSCISENLLVCLRHSESSFSGRVLSFMRYKREKTCHSLLQAQCDVHSMYIKYLFL